MVIIMILALPRLSRADLAFTVNSANSLDKIASTIAVASTKGTYKISFAEYANVGKFQLGGSAADTLLFARSSDTDAVVDITGTLFDIKALNKTTVILKNLAFRITDPTGVFISGADAGRQNGNLLIDSCFIFSDNLNSRFLSWIADNNSNITISHSFLVTKTGNDTISLTAGIVKLNNDNINFSGLLSTATNQNLILMNNTINRAQINADGELTSSSHQIAFNLFAFHSKRNFVPVGGAAKFYPIRLLDFKDPNPIAPIGNHRFDSWADFDPPPITQFSERTNIVVDSVTGRDSSELWDWNLPLEKTAGFANGEAKSPLPFNVFPKDSAFTGNIDVITGAKFFFKRSLIPRRADPQFQSSYPLDSTAGAYLRFVWPNQGGLRLSTPSHSPIAATQSKNQITGTSFTLDSLILPGVKDYASTPVLTAYQNGKYQEPDTVAGIQHTHFINKYPGAQNFSPAFYGNTPRGKNIVPAIPDIHLLKKDTLVFDKIDSAGKTIFYETLITSKFRRDFRYLDTRLNFISTAKYGTGKMLFGTLQNTAAFDSSKVHWWLNGPDTLIRSTPVNGKQTASYKSVDTLDAFLVEIVSVPRGSNEIQIGDGMVHTASTSGYQMNIDSLSTLDSSRYGMQTKGYKFTWVGRGDTDAIVLNLRHKTNQEAFIKIGAGDPLPLVYSLDSTKDTARIVVTKADSGAAIFLASKFNVIKDSTYSNDSSFGAGVSVNNFRSSVSARLSILGTDQNVLKSAPAPNDSIFRYLYLRGGKTLSSVELQLAHPWEMDFKLPSVGDRSKIEVWWTDGSSIWAQLPSSSLSFLSTTLDDFRITEIPPTARTLVAIERLQAPETYIDHSDTLKGDSIEVKVMYKNQLDKAINQYCVLAIGIDRFGERDSSKCDTNDIGTPSKFKLEPNKIYVYGIQYFTGDLKYGSPLFQPVSQVTWNSKDVLSLEVATQQKKAWHMVGMPFTGTFKNVFVKDSTTLDTTNLDSTYVYGIGGNPAAAFVPVAKQESLPLNFGDAYLVSSTMNRILTLGNKPNFLPIKPFTLTLKPGWNFIGNPFPSTLKLWKIKSTKNAEPIFFRFETTVISPTSRSYTWPKATDALKAFQGYAYFASANEQLNFDLLADSTVTGTLPKAGIAGMPTSLEIKLDASWSSSSMELTSRQGSGSIPFLPAPGSMIEMRVGGGTGYMRKAVMGLASIEEPVQINSPQKTLASFTLSYPGASVTAPNLHARLIDLSSGRIYDEASASQLPIEAGSHSYRLVAGSAAFIEDRINAFLAGAPHEIGLSQNFPNPVRSLTRITLDWPAIESQDRHATLQVLDTRGREVKRIDLDRVQVGRQVLTLDASAWSPGVYMYRLTVISGGERTRLQKRMLVTP